MTALMYNIFFVSVLAFEGYHIRYTVPFLAMFIQVVSNLEKNLELVIFTELIDILVPGVFLGS